MPEIVGLSSIMSIIALKENWILKPTPFARICCFPRSFGFLRGCFGVKEKTLHLGGLCNLI